jgi:4-amino-4-deoxy-L-arabinose transferase-like glycosyltransferase
VERDAWKISRMGKLRRRIPELALLALGIGLRFSMLRFDARQGYDGLDNFQYIEWFQTHWTLPPLMLSRTTYHPPLFYVMEGNFRGSGASVPILALPSMIFASLTLILLFIGLERHMAEHRLGRLVALALAAVLPCSVHLSGMWTAEGLNGFLATAGLLVAAHLLGTPGKRRIKLALVLGVILGLEMLSKVSAVVILASVVGAAGLEAWWSRGPIANRLRGAVPWLWMLAAFALTSGWYFARNQHLYGKAVLSGFDGREGMPAAVAATPYLDRRTLGFVAGWSNDVFRFPYFRSGITPHSRFWPVVVASTFADYYNHSFAKYPKQSELTANTHPISRLSVKFGRASVIAGTLIASSTAIAWFLTASLLARRRDAARLVLVIAPAVAILGQLHFAIQYPFDDVGPIKGVYLQFATVPLFGLFGLAVSWLVQRRATRPLAVVELVAVGAVAAYTIYCRVV